MLEIKLVIAFIKNCKQIPFPMIENFTSNLVNLILKVVQPVIDKVRQKNKGNLYDIYNEKRTVYSKIKTPLISNTSAFVDDIYVPIPLKRVKGLKKSQTKKIENLSPKSLFAESQYITLIGQAGSGKSTFLKKLYLDCIKEKAGYPLLIELRQLSEGNSDLEKYIKGVAIQKEQLFVSEKILQEHLEKGEFVFLLDGYDEISLSIKSMVIQSIKDFTNKYNKNKFIVTARPDSSIELFHFAFDNYYISSLGTKEINQFINKNYDRLPRKKEELKNLFSNPKITQNNPFLSTPLHLLFYLRDYEKNTELSMKKSESIQRFIQTLFEGSDEFIKSGFNRGRYCDLKRREIEKVLSRFSFYQTLNKKYNFSMLEIHNSLDKIKNVNNLEFNNNSLIKDLKYSIGLWREEGNGFLFDSIQDFYSSLYISSQDDSEKEGLYKTIIESIEIAREVDYSDLAEFSWEMDKEGYTNFFLIPILIDINKRLGDYSEKFFIQKNIQFFFQEITVIYKNEKPIFKAFSNKRSISIYKLLPNKVSNILKINDIGSNLMKSIENMELDFTFDDFENNESKNILFQLPDTDIPLFKENPIFMETSIQLKKNVNHAIRTLKNQDLVIPQG